MTPGAALARRRVHSSIAAALAAALTVVVGPPASAASGSWTINLGCKLDNGQQIDIVIVDYSFEDLVANTEGFVAGRHTYGAGPNDFVSTSNNATTDAAGDTANTYEILKSHLTTATYTPTAGDVFTWRVFLNGDVLTGSTSLGGAGCAGSTITAGTPTIAGTAKVGMALTAAPGSWSPAGVAFSYQWYADGTSIPGATGDSLLLAPAQVGKGISVRVTGSKAGYTAVAKTSAVTTNVAPGTLAPAPKPKIKGKAKVGEKLTAKPGTWGPGEVAKTYQWYANGKAISGATGKSLKLKASHAGKRITVKVTGTKAGYDPVTNVSAATVKIKH
jgi:hypothetical protein